MKTSKSREAFERACKVLVGGVNSPVRAFAAVGGQPPLISRACGSHIIDLDGNEYVDYVCSYGPLILGHAQQEVVTAIHKAVLRGTSFGATTEEEVELAELVISAIPRAEKIRFTSSGTEAVMTALRLARGVTGRRMVVKFRGCYHGHCDAMLVQAGSGATTTGQPSSAGVPVGATSDTLLADYNDLDSVRCLFEEYGSEIATVLVEPVAGNMGVVPPAGGFLQGLREICDAGGAMLIFDEVMTGFRVAWGGAQELYGVQADITTLGKIIGGGMPVGAVAGPSEIMDRLSPLGDVYQAGTLSGNGPAMAAGIATLTAIRNDADFYSRLDENAGLLERMLRTAAGDAAVSDRLTFNRVGSMMCVFFRPGEVKNYDQALECDKNAFAKFFGKMLGEGVFLPPSQYEAWFVSSSHTQEDFDLTASAAKKAFEEIF
ncbi:MAG TPA: glutamate-1-semialdehyde 2,1-aminomutase [Phycisphaerae bacterium]|nr:glutamate-1-semialdehyde 2,1-aminomutase [Phycisphaerae bacterium]